MSLRYTIGPGSINQEIDLARHQRMSEMREHGEVRAYLQRMESKPAEESPRFSIYDQMRERVERQEAMEERRQENQERLKELLAKSREEIDDIMRRFNSRHRISITKPNEDDD
jgi:hypothetical protein